MENEVVTTMVTQLGPAGEQFYNVAMWVCGIVGFLLAVALFYVILILRDASYVSRKARETSDTVNEYIKKPAGMIIRAVSSLEGVGEIVMSQVGKLMTSKKKKRRAAEEDDE